MPVIEHDCHYREGWLLRGQKLNEANAEVERLRHALRVQDDPTLSEAYKRDVRREALGRAR